MVTDKNIHPKYPTKPSTEDRLLNVKVWRELNKDNKWVQFISEIWLRQLERDLSLQRVGLKFK
ncbi:MAG: hypothetical protein CMA64_00200 [Euryarchaeota archaeon]|jgi:hypothetical protein|nr:hypothetical protein [Euryarchaeota archaeon]